MLGIIGAMVLASTIASVEREPPTFGMRQLAPPVEVFHSSSASVVQSVAMGQHDSSQVDTTTPALTQIEREEDDIEQRSSLEEAFSKHPYWSLNAQSKSQSSLGCAVRPTSVGWQKTYSAQATQKSAAAFEAYLDESIRDGNLSSDHFFFLLSEKAAAVARRGAFQEAVATFRMIIAFVPEYTPSSKARPVKEAFEEAQKQTEPVHEILNVEWALHQTLTTEPPFPGELEFVLLVDKYDLVRQMSVGFHEEKTVWTGKMKPQEPVQIVLSEKRAGTLTACLMDENENTLMAETMEIRRPKKESTTRFRYLSMAGAALFSIGFVGGALSSLALVDGARGGEYTSDSMLLIFGAAMGCYALALGGGGLAAADYAWASVQKPAEEKRQSNAASSVFTSKEAYTH